MSRERQRKRTEQKSKSDEEEEERVLYEPISEWLEMNGYYALITHGKKEVAIWIGDIFHTKTHIEPDVVGVKKSWTENVWVEAKASLVNIFDVIGKCEVWKVASERVYLAYPRQKGFRSTGFEKLGIGLLEVAGDSVKEVAKPEFHGISEQSKSQELFTQIWNVVRTQDRASALQITEANAYKINENWSANIRYRNTGSEELRVIGLTINQYSPLGLKIGPKLPSDTDPLRLSPYDDDYLSIDIPKTMFKTGSSI